MIYHPLNTCYQWPARKYIILFKSNEHRFEWFAATEIVYKDGFELCCA